MATVRPAAAATPCWKALLNDWYDGRIDNTYALHCYTDALKHLPPDVQTYSSAHDDIERALQSAIAKLGKKKVTSTTQIAPPPPVDHDDVVSDNGGAGRRSRIRQARVAAGAGRRSRRRPAPAAIRAAACRSWQTSSTPAAPTRCPCRCSCSAAWR